MRRSTEIILIAMFVAIIGLPLAGKLLPSQGAFALTENRAPAPFPKINITGPGWGFSIVSFPRRFERFWNDSFAFRWYLIRAHSLASVALGVSPSPKALVGTNGFLFYAGEQSVDYFRRTKPFNPAGLARWREDLESRAAWLAARGIRYLVVVAPNKETIYPEFMPAALRPLRPESRLDQLLDELHAKSSVNVVDLRGALVRAKADGRVYHKTDTHWNDAGALVASREILRRLKVWFPELAIDPPPGALEIETGAGGDLARILALEDRFPEQRIVWKPHAPVRARLLEQDGSRATDIAVTECRACDGPSVVMNHDSFNANLAPFLAEHFRRAVFVDGTKLDLALIERERPQVVVQEFVERALMCADLHGC